MRHGDFIQLRSEFVLRAKTRFRKQREHAEQRQRDERTKRKLEEEQSDFDDLAQVLMATDDAIAQFRNKLDEYQETVMQRILDLQNKRDQLLTERSALLAGAHVLPDGRRVFRSEDGLTVFDENRNTVSPDLITPSEISDEDTSRKEFLANADKFDAIDKELDEAVTVLEHIDDMQDRLDEGKITASQLDDLKTRLDGLMTESFKQKDIEPVVPRDTSLPADEKPFDPGKHVGFN